MHDLTAYLNGRWVSPNELSVSIFDNGFVQGTTVAEQLRTFNGQLFRLNEHLERLFRSLEIVGVDPGHSPEQLTEIAEEVIRRNYPQLAAGDDLGLGMFVTPGVAANLITGAKTGPTVCVYCHPLPFHLWAEKFATGEELFISSVQQISPRSWPPELKCRSRMHYYLADREAREQQPGARAILLDETGMVSEATTANLVLYKRDEGLVSPPIEKILPGISLGALADLAAELGILLSHRDIRPEELFAADELLLTSTSICVQPVVRCHGQPIGTGQPGAIFRQLLAAWSARVGVDIAEQAVRFARRAS